jgi:uncharacterized protein (DUF1501 family)
MLDIIQSRRNLLRVGALSSFGLTLPGLLRHEAQARSKESKRSVILVYLGGGMSHHDTFDPKPDAVPEVKGEYNPIHTNVPGLLVSEKLPMMARVMDKVALVRSGAHNNDHHETATNWVMSGRFGSAFGDYPAMGAVVAHETGFQHVLPPYVSIPRNPSFTWELGKSAYLGGRYESFKAGDPNAADYKVQDLTPAEPLTSKRAERRADLLEAVDGLTRKVEGNDQIKTYDEFAQRAAAMILSSEARDAFAIDKESDKLRDRFGRTQFGQSCLLARRLAERGVRFVTVNFGGWDHHAKIWDGLKSKLPDFDQAFSALISDLHERGLLDNVLVVAMGEFGRTPKINKDVGRDHWGPAASILFAGCGARGGLVLGATDKEGAYVTRRPVAPADVSYTIFDRLGINPRKLLQAPDGRPQEILDKGEPVNELFS